MTTGTEPYTTTGPETPNKSTKKAGEPGRSRRSLPVSPAFRIWPSLRPFVETFRSREDGNQRHNRRRLRNRSGVAKPHRIEVVRHRVARQALARAAFHPAPGAREPLIRHQPHDLYQVALRNHH